MWADLLKLTPYLKVSSHPLPIQFRAYFIGLHFYVVLQHLGDSPVELQVSFWSSANRI
jgi:hypothetical protein